MFRFLHAADLHLDSPLLGLKRYGDAPVDDIRGATRKALESLVALAIEEKVAFIVIAGDLYDGAWKDYNTGLFFARQMGRLREAAIPVFLVLGNHDAESRITRALRPPDNVRLFSPRKVETALIDDLGVAVHGRSFPAPAVSQDLSAEYPSARPGMFNIGLLHTSLTGREGHDPYAPCTVEGLRTHGYQYWALGHVHAREEVCRDPWVVFPGNVQGRHARETGPKGATLVSVQDGEVASVEHRDLDVVRWSTLELHLDVDSTAQDALDRMGVSVEHARADADGRTLACRVVLSGRCRAHREFASDPVLWAGELRSVALSRGGDGFWVEKVKFSTSPPQTGASAVSQDVLGRIAELAESMAGDSGKLPHLAEQFKDLRLKLPAQLLQGEGGLDPTDPLVLKEMLREARDLLLSRLSGTAGGEQ